MIARHWLRQPVGLPPRLLPGSVGLDNRRLRVAHDGGTARARHSSPAAMAATAGRACRGGSTAGRLLCGYRHFHAVCRMPRARAVGQRRAALELSSMGEGGGRAIKSRQDGTRSRVLETTHERRGSMGRVKCSQRGGTTTDNDGDGVCGRRGLYVFLSGNLGSRGAGGGQSWQKTPSLFLENARPDSEPASAAAQICQTGQPRPMAAV